MRMSHARHADLQRARQCTKISQTVTSRAFLAPSVFGDPLLLGSCPLVPQQLVLKCQIYGVLSFDLALVSSTLYGMSLNDAGV